MKYKQKYIDLCRKEVTKTERFPAEELSSPEAIAVLQKRDVEIISERGWVYLKYTSIETDDEVQERLAADLIVLYTKQDSHKAYVEMYQKYIDEHQSNLEEV